jgi:hypothetical protein
MKAFWNFCRNSVAVNLIAMFSVVLALTSSMVYAKQPSKNAAISTAGKTADGKYPIYRLQGEIDDLTYMSDNFVYQPNELIGKMEFIKKEDVNKGVYACGYVCKDKADHIVGINPAYKWMIKKGK